MHEPLALEPVHHEAVAERAPAAEAEHALEASLEAPDTATEPPELDLHAFDIAPLAGHVRPDEEPATIDLFAPETPPIPMEKADLGADAADDDEPAFAALAGTDAAPDAGLAEDETPEDVALPTHLIAEEGDIEIIFEAMPDFGTNGASRDFGGGQAEGQQPDEELEAALHAVGDAKETMHGHRD
jgi:hypothetical protein